MAGIGAVPSGEVTGRQAWLHVCVFCTVTLEPSSRRHHPWFNALLSPFWNSDINTSLLTFIPLFSPLRYRIGTRVLRLQAAGTNFFLFKIAAMGTSLVVQQIRIHLPMHGMWVWSLVQEDSASHGATKPTHQNCWSWCYRAHKLQPLSSCAITTEAHMPTACAPQ